MAGQEPVVTTRTGALGPRLIGRLTAELILRSPQFMNPLKHYEIDLRGVCARGAQITPIAPPRAPSLALPSLLLFSLEPTTQATRLLRLRT
jgi:hypothetical protein